jgi:hypothetical protein
MLWMFGFCVAPNFIYTRNVNVSSWISLHADAFGSAELWGKKKLSTENAYVCTKTFLKLFADKRRVGLHSGLAQCILRRPNVYFNVVLTSSGQSTHICALKGKVEVAEVAPQLYSRGWVDPVPDPLLLRKSDSAGNRTHKSYKISHHAQTKHSTQSYTNNERWIVDTPDVTERTM